MRGRICFYFSINVIIMFKIINKHSYQNIKFFRAFNYYNCKFCIFNCHNYMFNKNLKLKCLDTIINYLQIFYIYFNCHFKNCYSIIILLTYYLLAYNK